MRGARLLRLKARAEWSAEEEYEFLVSPLDAWVRRYRWWVNKGGYIYRRSTLSTPEGKKSVNVYVHREIMGLDYGDRMVVDHRNGLPSDNTRANLEVVTQGENLRRIRL